MKKKKIHVLVIPTWYPIGTDKLMGQYHREYTEALNKNDEIMANMLYIQREKISTPLKYLFSKKYEFIEENGYVTLKREMLNLRPISYDLQMHMYAKMVLKAYKKYEKIYGKPDIIHAEVITPAGYAACKLGEKNNVPVIVTEHATYAKRFFEGKDKKYSEYVINNAVITTVSKTLDEMLKDYVKVDHRLPNQVNTKIFANNHRKKKNDTLDLIQVCALRKVKRTDLIMEAMKILMEEYDYKKIHLTVVGDGFDREYFENVCTDLEMNEYVSFVGQKNKSEISEYLSKADIMVIASDIETFGIPGIESLASGVPVVSTDCGGVDEYLDERSGLFAKVGDAKSIAEKIDELYKNIDKYDEKTLKSIANNYSDEQITKTALKIYKDMLK